MPQTAESTKIYTGFEVYRTSDIPLAAYLVSEGFKLLDIDYGSPRAVIIFLQDSRRMAECIHDFQLCRAMGNIVLFHNALRHLKWKINRRLPV